MKLEGRQSLFVTFSKDVNIERTLDAMTTAPFGKPWLKKVVNTSWGHPSNIPRETDADCQVPKRRVNVGTLINIQLKLHCVKDEKFYFFSKETPCVFHQIASSLNSRIET